MNLAQAIEYFIDNLPEDPTGHDDILNECLVKVQQALGQPCGDAAHARRGQEQGRHQVQHRPTLDGANAQRCRGGVDRALLLGHRALAAPGGRRACRERIRRLILARPGYGRV